jgi:hypothetical protein
MTQAAQDQSKCGLHLFQRIGFPLLLIDDHDLFDLIALSDAV